MVVATATNHLDTAARGIRRLASILHPPRVQLTCQTTGRRAGIVASRMRPTARRTRACARDRVQFAHYTEGTSVQILHVGPFDSEAPVLARLHDEYLPKHGLTFNGQHHEVYLSDARRTDSAKLRTILRQPVASGW